MTNPKKFFVVAIDRFLSGWGAAADKLALCVIACNSLEEANIVRDNAKNRSDMINVRVVTRKPYQYYKNDSYFVQNMTKENLPNWFEAGYFK